MKTARSKPGGGKHQDHNGSAQKSQCSKLDPDPDSFPSDAAPPTHRANQPLLRSDEQLLEAYCSGDRNSFTELVSRYERELYHFLVRFLTDRAAAEDVFQETFLQIHQSAQSFDTHRRFRPWMFTIAANKARDLIRSNARRPASALQASISSDQDSGEFLELLRSSEELPDMPMQKRELRQKVQTAVTSMPEHLREILLLSYFHQFPYQQISDILDIPLGTVKSRLHSAVAYFADRWRTANPGHFQS